MNLKYFPNTEWLATLATESHRPDPAKEPAGNSDLKSFEIVAGGYAILPTEEHKILLDLMVYTTLEEIKTVRSFYASMIFRKFIEDDRRACEAHSISDLADLISTLVVWKWQHAIKIHPEFGMEFAGIRMTWGAYRNRWKQYEDMAMDRLIQIQSQCEWLLGEYRKGLKAA